MITYSINKYKEEIKSVKVSGHALFADYGTDIVCASVSTAVIMTANAIECLGDKQFIKVSIAEGSFELEVLKSTSIIQGLLKNLTYTLKELETQYHTNIKNQKEE